MFSTTVTSSVAPQDNRPFTVRAGGELHIDALALSDFRRSNFSGGALRLEETGSAFLTEVLIKNNGLDPNDPGGDRAGAIFAEDDSTLSLVRCVVADNSVTQAGHDGGAVGRAKPLRS